MMRNSLLLSAMTLLLSLCHNADAGDYRLHQTASGLNNKTPPPSGAEDVRSFDKPLLGEPAPRKSNVVSQVPSRCETSTLGKLNSTQREAVVSRELAGDEARRCFAALFTVDVSHAVQWFHQGQMDNWALQLRDGDTRQQHKAIYWLRAAYFARQQHAMQFYTPNTLLVALDKWLAATPNWSVKQAPVFAEALLLADSARLSAAFHSIATRVLNESDDALNDLGGRRRVFAAQVLLQSTQHNAKSDLSDEQQRTTIKALAAFAGRHQTGYSAAHAFLLNNAMALLAGFAQYENVRGLVISNLQSQLAALTPANADWQALPRQANKTWVRAADIFLQFASSECAALQLCDAANNMRQRALPIRHQCADTLLIWAQEMSTEQLAQSCQRLLPIEQRFHQQLATQQQKLPGDQNEHLDVIVFDDWSEYDIYATALYQISSNNGGMYLEGKPEQAGNQARFVSHEADWLRPNFVVWNLEHEYVHYLDGRFNVAGDYNDTLAWPLVWWQEGVAEYFARGDDDNEALTVQQKRQLMLSDIFATPVDPWDVDRVYRLGYLAARYMIQQQPDKLQQLRELLRQKRFAEYQTILQSTGRDCEQDFSRWWRALSDKSAASGKAGEH